MPTQSRKIKPKNNASFYVSVSDAVLGTNEAAGAGVNPQGGATQTANGIANIKFTHFEGGNQPVNVSSYNNGVDNVELPLAGLRGRISDITLKKPYSPEEDYLVYAWFERYKDSQPGVSVSITPISYKSATSEPEVLTAMQVVFTDCIIIDISTPMVDRTSSDVSMLEIKLAPSYVRYPNSPGGSGA